MNFVGHVTVALSTQTPGRGDSGFAFGAALPDLVSMAGVRLEPCRLPEAVREGVACHHRTDAAFHSLPAFTTGVGELRDQLKAAGMAVGPSRAIGHAGWELLLDGCLLQRPRVADDFAGVLERAPDLAESISPGEPDRWRRLVAGMRSDQWYLGYTDAAAVAYRLHRRLRGRRRLAFPAEQIPLVAAALALAKPAIDLASADVMSAVTATLTGSSQLRPATTRPVS